MSPMLFNIYAEAMMIEAMDGVVEEVKIGGKTLQDVGFADDQGMIASSETGLQKIMNAKKKKKKKNNMKIKIKKTKVMRASKVGGKVFFFFLSIYTVLQLSPYLHSNQTTHEPLKRYTLFSYQPIP